MSEPTAYRKIAPGTERSFGLTVGTVLAIIGVWSFILGKAAAAWIIAAAVLLIGCGLLFPRALRPVNHAWFRLGLFLNRIVEPVVMLVMFCVLFVPLGVAMRLIGKDLLRLHRDPSAESYWILRNGADSHVGSMKNQF